MSSAVLSAATVCLLPLRFVRLACAGFEPELLSR